MGQGASNNSGVLYNPAWFNYDFTVARKFGKFTIGAIAYGSQDSATWCACSPRQPRSTAPRFKQSQFAVGGLVGYDFGSFSATFKLSRTLPRATTAAEHHRLG